MDFNSNPQGNSLLVNPDNGGMGTGPSDIAIPKVGNMFGSKTGSSFMQILSETKDEVVEDTTTEENKDIPEEVKAAIKPAKELQAVSLISELEDTKIEEADTETSKEPKVTKASVAMLKDLIENEGFETYDDYDESKPLDEYLINLTEKERTELVKSNLKARDEKRKEELRDEVFSELPGSLQYAAAAVANGATEYELRDIYAALLRVEESKALNVDDEYDQEQIVRQYLHASGFGAGKQARIEKQLAEWKEGGKLDEKAREFKPDLDQMHEQRVQYQLQQQEEYRQQQEEMQRFYTQSIVQELKKGDIDGLKLGKKEQNEIYNGLTTVFQSEISGKPVNSLGAALERIQFSDKPDYKLLIKLNWLATDPVGYDNAMKQLGKNEGNVETEKKLKSAQQMGAKASVEETTNTGIKKKGIQKVNNIFK